MIDLIGLAILVTLFILSLILGLRVKRTQNQTIRIIGLLFFGGLTVVSGLALVLAILGYWKLNSRLSNPVTNITVDRSPEKLARGERWAQLCTGCHSTANRLPLDGSPDSLMNERAEAIIESRLGGINLPENLTDLLAALVGPVYGSNLTPSGPMGGWTDGEVIRAIREGVYKDGRTILIMPSDDLRHMSDEDVEALVAYMRTEPPVERHVPATQVNVLGAILTGIGGQVTSAVPPVTAPITAPPTGTPEYGEYLVRFSGCADCHGQDLAGGDPLSVTPIGGNLTVKMPKWTEAQFFDAMQRGVSPDGHIIDIEVMPWNEYALAFTDEELKAMFAYLHALTPVE